MATDLVNASTCCQTMQCKITSAHAQETAQDNEITRAGRKTVEADSI